VGLGDRICRDAGEAVERMRCCAWSKLERLSVCAWTRASSGASCLRTATVAGWLLTKTRPLPVERISRRRMIVGAFGVDAVGFEDGFGAGRGLEDAGDDGLVGAVADDSPEDLPPMRRASASTRMDLPAPVSPVRRLRPGPKEAMA
jgi:hypothetical protein